MLGVVRAGWDCRGPGRRVRQAGAAPLPPVFVVRICWDGPNVLSPSEAAVVGTLEALSPTLDLGASHLPPPHSRGQLSQQL